MAGSGRIVVTDPPTRHRSLASRLLVGMCALLSCLVFLVTVGGYALYEHFDRQINRLRLSLEGDRPADPTNGATNYLLVGSDSRAGTDGEFESGGEVAGQRSDTTILAHLDADGTTTLVSFPRDTLVQIPGHGRDKLTQAFSIGGPSLLIRTVEKLTRIRVDHYISVDLAGFRQMTDAIGGVTVCVKALPDGGTGNLRDEWSQWRGRVGENHLDGDQALAFVRQRHGLPDNDFDRIRRQQQFIGAVFRKATSEGVLANPVRLENLLSAVTRSLTIDDGTGIEDLRRLAKRLGGLSSDQIRFMTIPVHTPTEAEGANAVGELPGHGAVQLYDRRELDQFLAPLRGENADDRSTVVPPIFAAADVHVDVYNGAGVGGLAASVSDDLAELGFEMGTPRDWPKGVVTDTRIRHAPDGDAAARAVAALLPDAELVEDRNLDGDRVALVLGTSFDGLTADAAGADAPAAATEPGSEAETTPRTHNTEPVTAAELVSGCTY